MTYKYDYKFSSQFSNYACFNPFSVRLFVQISANTSQKNILTSIEKLKDYSIFSFFVTTNRDSNLYYLMSGPFIDRKECRKQLLKIRSLGFKDVFIKNIGFCCIANFDKYKCIYFSKLNLWLEKDKNKLIPLFSDYSPIKPVVAINKQLIFIKDYSLFALNLKTLSIKRLTLNINKYNVDKGISIKDLNWDPASRNIIFQRKFITRENYWKVSIDKLILQKINLKHLSMDSYKKFNTIYDEKYGLKIDQRIKKYNKEKGPGKFFIAMESFNNRTIIVKFTITNQVYWRNSVWIKSDNKEIEILSSISNF